MQLTLETSSLLHTIYHEYDEYIHNVSHDTGFSYKFILISYMTLSVL